MLRRGKHVMKKYKRTEFEHEATTKTINVQNKGFFGRLSSLFSSR